MSHLETAPAEGVDFHTFLKSGTAEAHIRLESLPISKMLVSENLTLETYREYLSAMRIVHLDAEQNLFPMLQQIIPDLESRRKSALLDSDLGSAYELNKSLFKSTSPGFALGVMYVLEGSTLGGRYILKNIEKTLKLSADSGASYFNGYGNATGSMWKAFLQYLATYQQSHGGEEIIRGAVLGFETIHHLLETGNYE